ncbi:uncharacterized [Tachysurus ichikawai]
MDLSFNPPVFPNSSKGKAPCASFWSISSCFYKLGRGIRTTSERVGGTELEEKQREMERILQPVMGEKKERSSRSKVVPCPIQRDSSEQSAVRY